MANSAFQVQSVNLTNGVTGVLPAANGGVGAGAVLQTLSTTKTDTFSTTGTSFADVTGLSRSITPASASNKVLVIVTMCVGGSTANQVIAQLLRGSTAIGIGDAAGSRTRAAAPWLASNDTVSGTLNISFLDIPATTSATTYKIQMRCGGVGTVYLNRSATDTDADGFVRGASTITVQEIKG
jgi:hypothetical protein